ncbi:hypothetical protein QBC40DRAFT_350852 [Triangularia verruculosa]|uniref:Uncharacterized protein n=1 Tax=Triangularia verruculosa TaxID=2587418 RepID=A0AAN7AQS2_9PEZI|nr:hypothetical protein QBC40DRAFT_350852 [Triangularia verruculosa]
MGSIVEKTSAGTIYKAATNAEHPELDLLTFLFESPHTLAEETSILHADAASPDNNHVTKSQLRTLVKSTASILRHEYGIGASGLNKDVVLAISTGHYLLPSLFYSTIAAGGIFSASNPGSTPKELAAQIKQVGVKVVLCNADTKATAIAAAKLTGLPPQSVVVYSSQPGRKLLLTPAPSSVPLSPSGELSWTKITSRRQLDDSIICLLFSSGTTGPPKACLLSHTNIVAEAALVLDPNRDYYTKLGLPHVYRTVAHLPAAHIAGIQGYFVNPFYLGGAVYWMRVFDFPLFLQYTAKYKVTQFFSVPPVFLLIAKSPLVTDQFATVEHAVSGAAPMGKELQRAAKAKLGGGRLKKPRLMQTWGLSETTGSVTILPFGSEFEDDESGSVSALVAGIEARIVGEDGKDVEVGEEGEIWVRGPMITKGYWNNEQANREGFADGGVGRERWFKTGDIAVYKGGLFYIVDRKKELIKYKGNQVAPAELEALLISHPEILDAAVIGVDDENEGIEVPRAYVVVADQKGITGKEIQDWVAKQVSNHKKLRGGVVFLTAIQKSPSGKILRKDLRALAKKRQQGGKPDDLQPNPDIGGKGVLTGFLGTAWLVVSLVILHYLFAFDPSKTFRKVMLSMCDVQLLTGLGILLSAYLRVSCYVSAYHWQLVVYLAWLSNLTHVACLTVLRVYLDHHPRERNIRLFCMTLLWLGLFPALVPTLFFNWGHNEPTAAYPASDTKCFFNLKTGRALWQRNLSGDDKLAGTKSFESAIISILLLFFGYFTRSMKLVQPWSNRLRARIRNHISRPFLKQLKKHITAKTGEGIRPRHRLRGNWPFGTVALMEATYLMTKHYTDLFTSEISDVYWLIVSAAWCTWRLFDARSSVDVEDNDWGFGQILPVFLLLGPIFVIIQAVMFPDDVAEEACGDSNPHSPNGVSNVPIQHSGVEFAHGSAHGTLQSTDRSEGTASIPLEELRSGSHRHVPYQEQAGTSLAPSTPIAASTPSPPDARHLHEVNNAEYIDIADSIRPRAVPHAVPVLDETDIMVVLDSCYRDKSRTAATACLTGSQVIIVTISIFLDRSYEISITGWMGFYFKDIS